MPKKQPGGRTKLPVDQEDDSGRANERRGEGISRKVDSAEDQVLYGNNDELFSGCNPRLEVYSTSKDNKGDILIGKNLHTNKSKFSSTMEPAKLYWRKRLRPNVYITTVKR